MMNPQVRPRDLTQHEIIALTMAHNLADAHTHQPQSERQRRIIEQLPALWYEAEDSTQRAMEQRFIDRFFSLQRQHTVLNKTQGIMLFYAASIALMTAATYFAKRKWTVSLIDPCFDNLRDNFRHAGVPLLPLQEEVFHEAQGIGRRLEALTTGDVICLVDPNNPTGFSLSTHGEGGFDEVIAFCKRHDKLLMLDLCFASFALMDERVGRIDVYEKLERSGVRYIAIEDTGKVWPVQDAKCALMVCSDDIHREIYDIYTSVLLNVSPFILNLLSAYIEDSAGDGFASVRNVLERNRRLAIEQLDRLGLRYVVPVVDVSVAWFAIDAALGLSATDLHRHAQEDGVCVLPGTHFFWSRPANGERYIRLALARRTDGFANAVDRLCGVLANGRASGLQQAVGTVEPGRTGCDEAGGGQCARHRGVE